MGDHFDGDAKRRRIPFATKIVVASVTAVVVYTIAMFMLAWGNVEHLTNIYIPSELTVSWYTFWTVELVALSSIKKSKIKNKYHRDDPGEGGM